MILEKITQECCNVCGAQTVSDRRQVRRHVNGQPFESRRFACGGSIEWQPQFGRQLNSDACPKSPELVERRKKVNDLKAEVMRLISHSDLADPALIEEIERQVSWAFRAGEEPYIYEFMA